VKDEVRRTRALHYLTERGLTVAETAALTGFSDPAAFSRAFKAWTGASPGSFGRARG
jgi:AraC-like DNA-binding protein